MGILLLFPLQVLFRLELEFSPAVVLDHVRVDLEASRCDLLLNSLSKFSFTWKQVCLLLILINKTRHPKITGQTSRS